MIALLLMPPNQTEGHGNFHFLRRDDDGGWSHKVGIGKVNREDDAGNKITDPEKADFKASGYTKFCGYGCVCPDKVQVAALETTREPGTYVAWLIGSGAPPPEFALSSQDALLISQKLEGLPLADTLPPEDAASRGYLISASPDQSQLPPVVLVHGGIVAVARNNRISCYQDSQHLESWLTSRAAPVRLSNSLDWFQRNLKDGCIPHPLANDLSSVADRARSHILSGHLNRADNVLSGGLLAIKRHLGTDVSLRQGFALASILVEDVRRFIADPAVLFQDAADFAFAFFQIYSRDTYRPSGLPEYLLKRPSPHDYAGAAAAIIAVVEGFGLPDEQRSLLISDIRAIEKHVGVFAQGSASWEELNIHNRLMVGLSFDIQGMQGIYLSTYQVMTVLGMLIFAVPAWLCAAPPAWIVQGIIVLGVGAYIIYSVLKTAASKTAHKNIWVYIEDCAKNAKQSVNQLKEEIKDLSDDEKKDVKEALQKSLDDVLHDKIAYTGKKSEVVQKLKAMVQAL